jgi:hypothetical protein
MSLLKVARFGGRMWFEEGVETDIGKYHVAELAGEYGEERRIGLRVDVGGGLAEEVYEWDMNREVVELTTFLRLRLYICLQFRESRLFASHVLQ